MWALCHHRRKELAKVFLANNRALANKGFKANRYCAIGFRLGIIWGISVED
jgi:hypothetical protein